MSRLIDADEFVARMHKHVAGFDQDSREWLISVADVQRILLEVPTVEPKRGGWILEKDPYEFFDAIPVCSNCGTTTKYREKYPYCPWCGAKMEGDETDEQVQET